ncbi:MAG: NAD-dependent epimerase/dehydratase family protein, partial [Candidatus Moranbacteria bacterium]|nr:NAD-dependent epimerase/dehydratase family protein [Candidatus Moranbacteria bacterium]
MITISGASGYLGKHLIKAFEGKKSCLAHSEKKMEEAKDENEWHIGDITDKDFTDQYIKGDLVIHCAAQKVIPIAENDPAFSIKNNVIGTLNVFQSAIKNNVKTVVFISTDKAYEPETIYGKTKEFGEWLCKYFNEKGDTKFLWCRYGNVLASSMSVFEVWDKLGKEGKD